MVRDTEDACPRIPTFEEVEVNATAPIASLIDGAHTTGYDNKVSLQHHEVEEKVKAARDPLSGDQYDATRLLDELESAMQRIGQDVYSQEQRSEGVGSQDNL